MLLWDMSTIRPMPSPLEPALPQPRQPPPSAAPKGQPGMPTSPRHAASHSPDAVAGADAPAKPAPPPYLHDVHAAPSATPTVCLKSSACSFAVRQTAVSADARTVLAVTEDGSLWRWDRA